MFETSERPEAVGRAAPPPAPPGTLEQTGLPADLLTQLLLKTLYSGEASGTMLAERLRLAYSILERMVDGARVEKLVEVRGAAGTGTAGYRYALTDLGRDRARQFLDINQYMGPAPVPLSQYVSYMAALAAMRGHVEKARLSNGFQHLIVNPDILNQLGPAVNSGKSVFLYGPPGNGKTVIAEGIGRAFGDDMFLPYALDVDGQIITMYDPVNHEALEQHEENMVVSAPSHDRRWIRIKRPVVVAGGELTLDMLDLTFNSISKFYEAPLQLKANAGVFVVDDFGRQRIRPRDLLNRWIVPLESRVDYLTLHTGKKFQVPFNVLIVFATNLNPETLADEAFLRRIPYKIYAKNPTVDEFSRIFEMNCRRRQLTFDPVVIEYMIRRYYEPRGIDMRACHPRDIVEQVVDMSRYQGREPSLSRDLIDAACRSYFIERTVETGRPQPRANGPTLRPTPRGTGGHASDAFRGSRGPAN
ncbi:MAG TPA: hypothetical protein VH702_17265 [Vicinamibacterales bacterium]|jgi:hypothetical protein